MGLDTEVAAKEGLQRMDEQVGLYLKLESLHTNWGPQDPKHVKQLGPIKSQLDTRSFELVDGVLWSLRKGNMSKEKGL